MRNSTVETPFWAKWENPGIFQKATGGLKGLFGLNREKVGRNFPVFPDDTFFRFPIRGRETLGQGS